MTQHRAHERQMMVDRGLAEIGGQRPFERVVDFGRPRLERPSSATTPKKAVASHNRTWAELMRRGLDIDVLECPDCGGRLRFVSAILLSSAIRRILCHLGLPSDPVVFFMRGLALERIFRENDEHYEDLVERWKKQLRATLDIE